jgi:hypothetical protein
MLSIQYIESVLVGDKFSERTIDQKTAKGFLGNYKVFISIVCPAINKKFKFIYFLDILHPCMMYYNIQARVIIKSVKSWQ